MDNNITFVFLVGLVLSNIFMRETLLCDLGPELDRCCCCGVILTSAFFHVKSFKIIKLTEHGGAGRVG